METINLMDPKRRRQNNVTLIVGYVLVACVILMLSVVLLYIAFGYGYKNGRVIQSGLLFVSSTPRPAQIYIDGKQYKDTTNTRLFLPEATYDFTLRRAGYRSWGRSIAVVGGQVESYSYPFLFPDSLTASTVQDYAGMPVLTTQSPDRRWLMIARPGSLTAFDVYDLNNPKKAPVVLNLPATLLSAGTSQRLQLVAWSGDNAHVLLRHFYANKAEYVLVSRTAPAASVNLTQTLVLPGSGIDLRLDNGKYNQYLALDEATHILSRPTLAAPTQLPYVNGVLAFAASGTNTLLYATPDSSDKTKVVINLYDGQHTYAIRRAPGKTTYLLALSSYQGDLYVAVSATSENAAFLYKNPVSQITNKKLGAAVPIRVLNIKAPNAVVFSPGGQYVAFEHGANFAVYDAENQQRFTYTVPANLDAPQSQAAWMDGARLQYISQGQLTVFDYDGQNRQTIVSADAQYLPYFDPNYKVLYTLVQAAADKSHELLTTTPLRTAADQ
jgi:hypothetical protein